MSDLDWWLLVQRFIWFCYQRRKKKNGNGSWRCTFGGSRWVIHILWRNRYTPATLPNPPDRGPGERVGRKVIFWLLPLNHLSPRGLVGYTFMVAQSSISTLSLAIPDRCEKDFFACPPTPPRVARRVRQLRITSQKRERERERERVGGQIDIKKIGLLLFCFFLE